MHLYNRSKHCSVQVIKDAFVIHSGLLDDFHEMILEMVVGVEDSIVRDIKFTMRRTPYEYCRDIEALAAAMKGVKLARGISKQAKEKLGGACGCSHLLDLFLEGVKVHVQAVYRLQVKRKDIAGIESGRQDSKDTCYYYSKIFRDETKKNKAAK